MQLHAPATPDKVVDVPEDLSKKVDNPYTFSIIKTTRFRSPVLTPETVEVTVYGVSPWYYNSWSGKNYVTNLTEFDGGAKYNIPLNTSMMSMFFTCENITSIELPPNYISSSSMAIMFYRCKKLTSIKNLSNCITSKVTNMSSMFQFCDRLTSLDLSNFDTSKVTDMNYMFYYCSSLTSLDLSNFDTSKVTNIKFMFTYCRNLTNIICPQGFDCSNITNTDKIKYMFDGCGRLKSPLHLKNVNSLLIESGSSPNDWVVSDIGGTRGVHYIVDSVI